MEVDEIIEECERKGLYYLITEDREGHKLLKVYRDPGLSECVAVYRISP